MRDRIFLDTNIFVYSFDRADPRKSAKAKEIIRQALAAESGVVSFQVVHEFFNVALRRFAQPMDPGDAEIYLATVFQPLLKVHSSTAIYVEALRLFRGNRISWYDSLIVAAAIRADCDRLLSEDLQHGQKFGRLQIVDPFR